MAFLGLADELGQPALGLVRVHYLGGHGPSYLPLRDAVDSCVTMPLNER